MNLLADARQAHFFARGEGQGYLEAKSKTEN